MTWNSFFSVNFFYAINAILDIFVQSAFLFPQ